MQIFKDKNETEFWIIHNDRKVYLDPNGEYIPLDSLAGVYRLYDSFGTDSQGNPKKHPSFILRAEDPEPFEYLDERTYDVLVKTFEIMCEHDGYFIKKLSAKVLDDTEAKA